MGALGRSADGEHALVRNLLSEALFEQPREESALPSSSVLSHAINWLLDAQNPRPCRLAQRWPLVRHPRSDARNLGGESNRPLHPLRGCPVSMPPRSPNVSFGGPIWRRRHRGCGEWRSAWWHRRSGRNPHLRLRNSPEAGLLPAAALGFVCPSHAHQPFAVGRHIAKVDFCPRAIGEVVLDFCAFCCTPLFSVERRAIASRWLRGSPPEDLALRARPWRNPSSRMGVQPWQRRQLPDSGTSRDAKRARLRSSCQREPTALASISFVCTRTWLRTLRSAIL
eukprot:5318504-Prymnesium_polylepis.1